LAGIACAFEYVHVSAARSLLRKFFGQDFGLVVAAFLVPGSVKWNGHKERSCEVAPEDVIFQGKLHEVLGQKRLIAIFYAVNQVAHGIL
jgi:hypothetical protein